MNETDIYLLKGHIQSQMEQAGIRFTEASLLDLYSDLDAMLDNHLQNPNAIPVIIQRDPSGEILDVVSPTGRNVEEIKATLLAQSDQIPANDIVCVMTPTPDGNFEVYGISYGLPLE